MSDFYLLTRDECHLCTQAMLMIHKAPVEEPIRLHLVDIEKQADLQQEYGLLIPVLIREVDDAELKWPFNEQQLVEFLQV
ncbi:thioredoxin family protein [Aliidiomarina minuta]|uniref:Thioredoxin family protein n=1 Tax=Aliidiomarina minuta TaxID=880057 RepID=A0A432W6K3_9GAMM|nr:glutaredoxin family protein [Aliidiomarina minuta]RUO25705.1 thioredoxin family protein [Aliidiomarina minuta]